MLNSFFLSSERRLVFLTYGRILLFFMTFVVFLSFYILKPYFIHGPMLFKTYFSFIILFSFYLYVLYHTKKHYQNKILFWSGLCLDHFVLASIMYFSNLPASWFFICLYVTYCPNRNPVSQQQITVPNLFIFFAF